MEVHLELPIDLMVSHLQFLSVNKEANQLDTSKYLKMRHLEMAISQSCYCFVACGGLSFYTFLINMREMVIEDGNYFVLK